MHERVWPTVINVAALVHHQDAVEQGKVRQAVRDVDDDALVIAAREIVQKLGDLVLALRIEGNWLGRLCRAGKEWFDHKEDQDAARHGGTEIQNELCETASAAG